MMLPLYAARAHTLPMPFAICHHTYDATPAERRKVGLDGYRWVGSLRHAIAHFRHAAHYAHHSPIEERYRLMFRLPRHATLVICHFDKIFRRLHSWARRWFITCRHSPHMPPTRHIRRFAVFRRHTPYEPPLIAAGPFELVIAAADVTCGFATLTKSQRQHCHAGFKATGHCPS